MRIVVARGKHCCSCRRSATGCKTTTILGEKGEREGGGGRGGEGRGGEGPGEGRERLVMTSHDLLLEYFSG